jgi:hypothetical protein
VSENKATITWVVRRASSGTFAGLQAEYPSVEEYLADREALREVLCDYFDDGKCASAAVGISPIGSTAGGGKRLKVRWNRPGMGKRGGLRLILVVYCEQRHVVLAHAFLRKDDPTDAEINAVTASL